MTRVIQLWVDVPDPDRDGEFLRPKVIQRGSVPPAWRVCLSDAMTEAARQKALEEAKANRQGRLVLVQAGSRREAERVYRLHQKAQAMTQEALMGLKAAKSPQFFDLDAALDAVEEVTDG